VPAGPGLRDDACSTALRTIPIDLCMGRFLGFVLVLAAAAGGLGYWNYQRNAHLDAPEQREKRPYESLSDSEVEMLLAAYQSEKQKLEQQLALVAQRQDPMQGYSPEDLSGKLQAFDKVQRNTEQWKRTNRQMLEQVVEIERLQKEQLTRAQGGASNDEWARIWRRVSTF